MKRIGTLLAWALLMAPITGWSDEPPKEEPTEIVKIGPVGYPVPKSWKRQAPSNSMRAAQFGIPLAEGDSGKIELTVFYFGPDQGGSVEQNIKRWLGQFKPLAGKEKVEKFDVGSLKITLLDANGAYEYKPFPAAPEGELMENWRMLAAVVETPDDGPYFFRMVGPKNTISAQEASFRKMLKASEPPK